MRSTDIHIEWNDSRDRTENMYLPSQVPVEEMSLSEARRGLCARAMGSTAACRSQEGARHGILAADGSHIQPQLGVQGPQQGREGLAPAQGLVPKLLKILLESEVGLAAVTAGGHQLGHRVHH